jgi:hypothetical protein
MDTTELSEKTETVTGSPVPLGQLCPYFTRPFPDCYCTDITSLKIPFVLRYCNGNQLTCDIYRRNSGENGE